MDGNSSAEAGADLYRIYVSSRSMTDNNSDSTREDNIGANSEQNRAEDTDITEFIDGLRDLSEQPLQNQRNHRIY